MLINWLKYLYFAPVWFFASYLYLNTPMKGLSLSGKTGAIIIHWYEKYLSLRAWAQPICKMFVSTRMYSFSHMPHILQLPVKLVHFRTEFICNMFYGTNSYKNQYKKSAKIDSFPLWCRYWGSMTWPKYVPLTIQMISRNISRKKLPEPFERNVYGFIVFTLRAHNLYIFKRLLFQYL